MRLETQKLEVTTYQISNNKIPQGFSGFRIAQVSDLHNAQFGEDNHLLLDRIQESQPDIIVITGDLIDTRKMDMDVAVSFALQAAQIAPCYFVNGNHEASTPERTTFLSRLASAGVNVLEDASVQLDRSGDQITLFGLDDPSLHYKYPQEGGKEVARLVLNQMITDTDGYSVLLAHHPEWIDVYNELGFDLVLSGHTHGGQIRFQKFGALIAPGQGFFPKYDRGLFCVGSTSMIISSGLGNSRVQLRLNNPPELVIIELHR